MADIDELARRAVDGLTRLASRAIRLALWVFVIAAVIATVSFLLGREALDGGIETVWTVLGVVFGAIAIGGALLASWRLATVRRSARELVGEVRTLLDSGQAAQRTVIETVEAGDEQRGGSVLVISREMHGWREMLGRGVGEFRKLPSAITAVTSFPGLLLAAIAITLVFAFLIPIFLLALAL
jgi:hypothetical protein